MHTLIGDCVEDWNQRSVIEIQIALDEIKKVQVIFDSDFISMCWEQQNLECIRVVLICQRYHCYVGGRLRV